MLKLLRSKGLVSSIHWGLRAYSLWMSRENGLRNDGAHRFVDMRTEAQNVSFSFLSPHISLMMEPGQTQLLIPLLITRIVCTMFLRAKLSFTL